MAQDQGSSDGNIKEIIRSLSGERAYLLVFALLFVVSAGSFFTGVEPAFATVITVASFVLAGFAIFQVERRQSVSVTAESKDQHQLLEGIRDEEKAIRGVLGGLVSDEKDAYFVYSSTPVAGYVDYEGTPIDYPYGPSELLVTAIPDAEGIARIHSLLHLAGKRRRLFIETAATLPDHAWGQDLILIGSKNSNPRTELALARYNSPYRFTQDVSAIVDAVRGWSRWPADREELGRTDFGLLVKLRVHRSKNDESTILILAGIGAIGTLAVCYYLERNVSELYDRFQDAPFGCVLSVDREQGYSSVELVTETVMPIFTRRR